MLGQATVRGEEKGLCGGTRQNNDWLNMGRCGGSGDRFKNGKRGKVKENLEFFIFMLPQERCSSGQGKWVPM